MRFGIATFITDEGIRPDVLGGALEDRGFSSLFIAEHSHIPFSRESPYPGGGELPRRYYRLAAGPPAEPGFDESVWDRWNAMSPREQATNFLDHDGRLVAAFEALTSERRMTVQFDLGFLPEPLSLASFAGMRLNESAQHSWDVRVAFDASAAIPADVAAVLAEHLAGGLGFLVGGRLRPVNTPERVKVTGTVTLDDLRRVFPGY